MELATREIAKEKLTTKLIHSSQDEIVSLAKAITELGNELEEYRIKVIKLKFPLKEGTFIRVLEKIKRNVGTFFSNT